MNILLIRSREQSVGTAARLAALGHAADCLPLTRIEAKPFELPARHFDGIIFTSPVAPAILASAIRADKRSGPAFETTAWCVGETTAAAAKEAGFEDIRVGPGGAAALARLIAAQYGRRSADLLYPSASDVALDMAAALKDQTITRLIAYEAVLEEVAAAKLESALKRAADGAVLLYSARSAAHFFTLASRYELTALLNSISIIAISEKVAAVADQLPGIAPKVAASPDEAAMLALL